MEVYFEHIPYFLLFVFIGVALNLMRSYAKTRKKIPWFRILEEVVGSVFIAAIVAGGLDTFTEWSPLFIYGVSALGGYAHSAILDFVGNGMLQYFLDIFKTFSLKGRGSSYGPDSLDTEDPDQVDLSDIPDEPDLN